MRFIILVLFGVLATATSSAETRMALVIHQETYTGGLSNVGLAPDEAGAIAGALESTGFSVTRVSDLDKEALEETLDNFRVALELAGPDAVGFVYYTGHGAQHPKTRDSYLLATDSKLRVGSDLARYGVNLSAQRDAFGAVGAKAVFLVFDACRNTPAIPGFKGNMKGLSLISASPEMLIAYSTSIDELAEEGVYAPILAEEILRPGQSAETAFLNAQKRVAQMTGDQQKPWSNIRLYSDIYFNGRQAPGGAETEIDKAEREAWEDARESASLVAIEDFLKDYPAGRFSADAKAMQALFGTVEIDELLRQSNDAFAIEDYGAALSLASQACDRGDQESCKNVGTLYEFGLGVPEDKVKARRLYEEACNNSYSPACESLGEMMVKGQGGMKDVARGEALFQAACDDGNSFACGSLGRLLIEENRSFEEQKRGVQLVEPLCADDSARACEDMATAYWRGWGVERNPQLARSFAKKSCELEVNGACYGYGLTLLSDEAGPVDEVGAARAFKAGCDWGDGYACMELGFAYEQGRGVEANMGEALAVHTKACDQSVWRSCHQLGGSRIFGVAQQKDLTKGINLLDRACSGGFGQSCGMLATIYFHGTNGVEKDFTRAGTLANTGIKVDDLMSYLVLAWGIFSGEYTPTKPGTGREYATKVCDANEAEGCTILGLFLANGIDGKRDEKKGFEATSKACELGSPEGCFNLSIAYQNGVGVRKNSGKAKKHRQAACQMGYAQAC